MSISPTELIWALVIAFLLAGALVFVFIRQRKEAKLGARQKSNVDARQLQLQAYERLILLTDRIALPNLIPRVNQPGMSAKEMQFFLSQNIRNEFDHNVTQRIYVSAETWDALNRLKDQNLLIINQVASILPENATGLDLNKTILEMILNNPKASLHNVVADALSYEAKSLMR
ncbi:MAG TPA: hypothetical protein VKR32_16540 [Puia sp.]|nr:hypothetical protein [Puia sp.]